MSTYRGTLFFTPSSWNGLSSSYFETYSVAIDFVDKAVSCSFLSPTFLSFHLKEIFIKFNIN